MTAISNLQRVIGMRGTKAQVEAFTATLEEQAVAYATDTGEFGVYTNGAWAWIDVSLVLNDLTDVDTSSADTNDVLAYTGASWAPRNPNTLLIRAWGSIYQDDASTTITVGAINTDYIVTGMTAGVLGSMTLAETQELVIEIAGVYKADWSLSNTTASANQEIEGAVGLNDARIASTSAHRKSLVGADTINMGGTGLLELDIGDLVQVVVRNETSASNIVVEHANLSLVFLGLTTGGNLLLESGDALLLESGDILLMEA